MTLTLTASPPLEIERLALVIVPPDEAMETAYVPVTFVVDGAVPDICCIAGESAFRTLTRVPLARKPPPEMAVMVEWSLIRWLRADTS